MLAIVVERRTFTSGASRVCRGAYPYAFERRTLDTCALPPDPKQRKPLCPSTRSIFPDGGPPPALGALNAWTARSRGTSTPSSWRCASVPMRSVCSARMRTSDRCNATQRSSRASPLIPAPAPVGSLVLQTSATTLPTSAPATVREGPDRVRDRRRNRPPALLPTRALSAP
jgi:hypothetical protein